jgi:hypothetical protein
MYGPALEYLAAVEHSRLINDRRLPRRAQQARELDLLNGHGPRAERRGLPGLGTAIARIAGIFAPPRTSAGHA